MHMLVVPLFLLTIAHATRFTYTMVTAIAFDVHVCMAILVKAFSTPMGLGVLFAPGHRAPIPRGARRGLGQLLTQNGIPPHPHEFS